MIGHLACRCLIICVGRVKEGLITSITTSRSIFIQKGSDSGRFYSCRKTRVKSIHVVKPGENREAVRGMTRYLQIRPAMFSLHYRELVPSFEALWAPSQRDKRAFGKSSRVATYAKFSSFEIFTMHDLGVQPATREVRAFWLVQSRLMTNAAET